MPSELLKFRCYRCNQLLAVAPARAGTVVACPRCKADLQIPAAESALQAETEKPARRQRAASVTLPLSSATSGSNIATSVSIAATSQANVPELPNFLTDVAAAIPPEVAELRPEDLRVEAEVFESITREPSPPPAPAPVPPPAMEAPNPIPVRGSKPELTPAELSNLFAPKRPAIEPSPLPVPPPLLSSDSQGFVPPIEIEPPSVRASVSETRRPFEVILPASVVLMWSIFVLVGIALSFVAGLMVGHFLWKVH